jgi:hypothetical protein
MEGNGANIGLSKLHILPTLSYVFILIEFVSCGKECDLPLLRKENVSLDGLDKEKGSVA